ncbi:MAG: HlyD family efflux transporter periplasmic adaptor subunit [Aliidongia sp.]
MSKLFRDEAIAGVTELKWGRPISLIPPSWWWMTLFFAVLAAAAITFLAFATFVRKETVPGVLALSRGELRIVAPRTGIIQEVYVRDGQMVEPGAPLVLISTEQQLAGGAIVDARVLQAIDDEQTMLKAQLDALDASTPLNERAVAERLRGTQNQITELTKAIAGRVERVAIARQASDIAQQLLDKGVMTATDARQRRTELLVQEQSLSDLKTQSISSCCVRLRATGSGCMIQRWAAACAASRKSPRASPVSPSN